MSYIKNTLNYYGGLGEAWGVPFLAPTITIPKNPQGTYIFPFGPEWRSGFRAGPPYVGQKPPPPLFGPGYNDPISDTPYWIYA